MRPKLLSLDGANQRPLSQPLTRSRAAASSMRERQHRRRLDLAERAGVGDDLLAAERAAAGMLGALERELGAAARALRDLRLLDRRLVEAALQGVVQIVLDDLDRLVDDRGCCGRNTGR